MTESVFADEDGCVRTGRIERSPGLWPEVLACYRIALPDEQKRYQQAGRTNNVVEAKAETVLIAAHLVSLHVVSDKGEKGPALPLNEKNVSRMHMRIRLEILNLITGWAAPELDADLKN